MGERILTQPTPNPNARKFILSKDVKRDGKVSFTDIYECANVPLAVGILELPHVTQVHFFENVITVTQDGAAEWSELGAAVEDIVRERLPSHDIDFAPELTLTTREHSSPELQRIEQILDDTIRPGLQADGGDLEVLDLNGHILTVHFEGACGGCPSATMGTLQAIEGILRDEYDPELQVLPI